MRHLSLRHRLAVAGVTGVAAIVATLGLGVGSATAAPVDPATGYPSFLNGRVSAIRDSGSDTTFFMMQKIGDLYTGAGLYGCTLNAGGEAHLYNDTFLPSTTATANDYCQKGANSDTTDTADNWDRTEVAQGVDAVGSTAGQKQLCGNLVQNSPLAVDFARSSKPAGTYCTGLGSSGYAKDGVPPVNYGTVNPSTFGTVPVSSPYHSVNGGNIGPVAAGWIPGDPLNGPYTGTPFNNVANGDATSIAYRLWCAKDSTQITDWGQLTNLSANGPGNGGVTKTVGNGAPIGLPIRILGVNSASGTVATFTGFVNGTASQTCADTNTNAATDPNPATAPTPNSQHIALENNASQAALFASGDFPGDVVDQAVEISTTLYYESNGVLNVSPFSGSVSLGGNSYTTIKMTMNSKPASAFNIFNNIFPTSRVLWNVYRTDTIRASVAGFLNWTCDDNSAIHKQQDNSTGVNFDTELNNIISSFGFTRLHDESPAAAISTPADGIAAPNTTCASGTTVVGGVTEGNGQPSILTVADPNN